VHGHQHRHEHEHGAIHSGRDSSKDIETPQSGGSYCLRCARSYDDGIIMNIRNKSGNKGAKRKKRSEAK
jgi:hypothetical protein